MNIKCKVMIKKKIFPKKKMVSGDWGVFVAEVTDNLDSKGIHNNQSIKIKGTFPKLKIGEMYKIVATPEESKYGITYDVSFICESYNLEKKEDKISFLRSILTEKEYKVLSKELDDPIKHIKEKDIKALTSVKGIGSITALKLIKKYENNIDYSEIYVKLQHVGLTKNAIQKLIEAYKSPSEVVKQIQDNPYILIETIDGYGFKKADDIALKNGIKKDSEKRIKGFLLFYLKQEGMNGHSYLYTKKLIPVLKDFLGKDVNLDNVKKVILDMQSDKKIWMSEDKKKIALMYFYELEKHIFKEIKRLEQSDNDFVIENVEEKLQLIQNKQGWRFTQEQFDFIDLALKNNVVLLTGSAGSGKTSVVNAVINILSKYNTVGVALAGKAADRLGEISDTETMTIHKLLENSEGKFFHNKENKLIKDVIIIDESSMIGGRLFYSLIQAIDNGSKLIIIGDSNQLEAIGECNVFSDLLSSDLPKIKLTEIHRQAKKSAIITDSIAVSKKISLCKRMENKIEIRGELRDFVLDCYANKDKTEVKVLRYFREQIKTNDILDVQIISPLKQKGNSSVYNLNIKAQKIYNPDNEDNMLQVMKYGKKYNLKLNDKIIIRKNNYKTKTLSGQDFPIYNGNIGIIKDIKDDFIFIELKNNVVVLVPVEKKQDIELGYAITCHSAQGSQFNVVIGAIDYSHYVLLTKELVYTMMSRAIKKLILCAESSALDYAIKTTYVSDKQTFLKDPSNFDFKPVV